MRIAYIGPAWGTSMQRARALGRLGHEVHIVDPWSKLGRSKLVWYCIYRSGTMGIGQLLDRWVEGEVQSIAPDIIFVNQGEFLGPKLIHRLRTLRVPIVNYANDNPFSKENWWRFRQYRAALPEYDLIVVVFADIVERAKALGARQVFHTYISADEVAHCPRQLSQKRVREYASEVAFAGTWMRDERGPFIVKLIRLGIPVSVWGDRWEKAHEWKTIKPYWRGPGEYDDDKYAAIIQSAKICLGLLNKASNNHHTGRSIQIPALGGLLCAERTAEHLGLYKEGEEAVFWNDASECAALCHKLLANESLRLEIAHKGHERALKNKLYNEQVMALILAEAQRVFRKEA